MSDAEQAAQPQPEILLDLTRGLVADEATRDEALRRVSPNNTLKTQPVAQRRSSNAG
jgi:hypothetical protein